VLNHPHSDDLRHGNIKRICLILTSGTIRRTTTPPGSSYCITRHSRALPYTRSKTNNSYRCDLPWAQAITNWRRFSRYRKWKYGVGRGRLESLSPAVCVSATMYVAFGAHGPWCKFVEYQMSNVEYQANFTHVLSTPSSLKLNCTSNHQKSCTGNACYHFVILLE